MTPTEKELEQARAAWNLAKNGIPRMTAIKFAAMFRAEGQREVFERMWKMVARYKDQTCGDSEAGGHAKSACGFILMEFESAFPQFLGDKS
jgi:hypothetical protein